MEYNDILTNLQKFPRIIVTGPQRSGTTIAGKILSTDLGYRYIDEGDHAAGTDVAKFLSRITNKRQIVVQCPILACRAHLIAAWDQKNTAIVYMRRNTDDIHKSQKRINWNWDDAEKKFLMESVTNDNIGLNIDYTNRISDIKYQLWDEYQKQKIENAFELDYESMKSHPMWLSEDKRKSFHAKQTSL